MAFPFQSTRHFHCNFDRYAMRQCIVRMCKRVHRIKDGKMPFSRVAVLLLFVLCVAESYPYLHPQHLQRLPVSPMQELVRTYFSEGYAYKMILCFLVGVHGIVMSMSTLKRIVRKLHLRRRGRSSHSRLRLVVSAIRVSQLYCLRVLPCMLGRFIY